MPLDRIPKWLLLTAAVFVLTKTASAHDCFAVAAGDLFNTLEGWRVLYRAERDAAAKRYLQAGKEGSVNEGWASVDIQEDFKKNTAAGKKIRALLKGKPGKNIFYPFSGTDLEGVFSFFPEAENIVFVQLEPFGNVIEGFEKLAKAHFNFGNGPNARGMHSFLNSNYGSTMAQEELTRVAGGQSPALILKILERFDGRIEDIQYLKHEKDGNILQVPYQKATGEFDHALVSFSYRGKLRRLVFLRSDVEKLDAFRSLFPERFDASIFLSIHTGVIISSFPKLIADLSRTNVVIGDKAATNSLAGFRALNPNDPVQGFGYQGALVWVKSE